MQNWNVWRNVWIERSNAELERVDREINCRTAVRIVGVLGGARESTCCSEDNLPALSHSH
eukprot:131475-Rhodomonas_salina.1